MYVQKNQILKQQEEILQIYLAQYPQLKMTEDNDPLFYIILATYVQKKLKNGHKPTHKAYLQYLHMWQPYDNKLYIHLEYLYLIYVSSKLKCLITQ